mgnify:CR=1 FL=1
MDALLIIVYVVLGYWAAGVCFYENKIVFHAFGELFMKKLILGIFLGIVIIPVAFLKRLFFRR